MRVRRRDHASELTGGAPRIAKGFVFREIELLGERFEVTRRDASHRIHELVELLRRRVELGEDGLTGVFDLVLGLTRLQPLGEIVPDLVEAIARHLENPSDVLRAVLVQEHGGLLRVPVQGRGAIPITVEHAERDEGVREVRDRARMEPEALSDGVAAQLATAEVGEELELDRAEEGSRAEKAHADLHDVRRV